MKKNTGSQYFTVNIVDVSTGASWNGTAYGVYKGDNGTLTQCANSVVQTSVTVSGIVIYQYTYSPTQAETNYDHVTFTIFGTGAVPKDVIFATTFPQSADVAAGVTTTAITDGLLTAAKFGNDTTVKALLTGATVAAAASTITLDGSAVGVNNYYDGQTIQIISGTGAGQARVITGYTSGKVATVSDAWATQPTAGAVYVIHPLGDVEVSLNNDKTGYALTVTPPTVSQIRTEMDSNSTQLAAIKAKTDIITAPPTPPTVTAIRQEIDANSTQIAAIKAKTDNLPSDPASNTQVATRMASFTYTAPPSASENAAAVRVELATELGRVDASITSRMATFTYNSSPTASEIWSYDGPRTLTDKAGFAPSPTQNASAVRTELAAELARLDATMSSRLAAVNYTAPDNASIAVTGLNLALALGVGFDSATDSLHQIRANTGIIDAAGIRSAIGMMAANLDVQLANIPGLAEIESTVLDALMADHQIPGTIGYGIRAAGNLGDPLGLTIAELQQYDLETYASLILKLNVGEPTEPVVPIPAPSLSVDDCIVYIDIKDSINVPITFKLSETARKNGVVLTETRTAYTDTLGRAVIALCRTDKMTPSGVFYKVTCEALHWHQKPLELTTSIYNLAELITDG